MMAAAMRVMGTSLPARKFIGSILCVAAVVLVCAAGSGATKPEKVRVGIDVLEEENFATLRKLAKPDGAVRVGVITNQTGVDSEGRRTIDVLAHAAGVKLAAIFSPEHGIEGKLDQENVAAAQDEATGLPVYSLYGETRRPTAEMLKGVDVLVFDIQDAGVRFFTYVTTMAYAMEAAAKVGVKFVVLDRPNPLGGEVIEGPVQDADQLKFTAYFRMPIRYGMTMGELAGMFNVENRIGADLTVLKMRGWTRGDYFADTGVKWVAPSPNLRTVSETFTYPGLDILQAAGVSVGRGTERPFEVFGAPWMDGARVARGLGRLRIEGVKFEVVKFMPVGDLYKGRECGGVAVRVTDAQKLRSVTMGLEIARLLWREYPKDFQVEKMMTLVGSRETVEGLKAGKPVADITGGWKNSQVEFWRVMYRYLIYRN
jgi:uncharacterized protein YbbC (DUF1343 family)